MPAERYALPSFGWAEAGEFSPEGDSATEALLEEELCGMNGFGYGQSVYCGPSWPWEGGESAADMPILLATMPALQQEQNDQMLSAEEPAQAWRASGVSALQFDATLCHLEVCIASPFRSSIRRLACPTPTLQSLAFEVDTLRRPPDRTGATQRRLA